MARSKLSRKDRRAEPQPDLSLSADSESTTQARVSEQLASIQARNEAAASSAAASAPKYKATPQRKRKRSAKMQEKAVNHAAKLDMKRDDSEARKRRRDTSKKVWE